jgi:hypothetical protein
MGRKVRLRRFTGPPRSWVETFQTVSLGSPVNRGNPPFAISKLLPRALDRPGPVPLQRTGY